MSSHTLLDTTSVCEDQNLEKHIKAPFPALINGRADVAERCNLSLIVRQRRNENKVLRAWKSKVILENQHVAIQWHTYMHVLQVYL
jgi:hypothetical protein